MKQQELKSLIERSANHLLAEIPTLQPPTPPGSDEDVSWPTSVLDAKALAGRIDHTALKAETTERQIRRLCEEGLRYHFASVCVNPYWVPLCAELLRDSEVLVCTVIGFPLGATSTASKVAECREACRQGAQEIDMVLQIGALKSGHLAAVARDIQAVAIEAHAQQAELKVIIETALLTESEKVQASLMSQMAGADFVKTSTGFSHGGATVADVTLMRRVVGPTMGIKAAGGIRTFRDAMTMITAGATRLGASAGVHIIEQAMRGTWDDSTSSSSLY